MAPKNSSRRCRNFSDDGTLIDQRNPCKYGDRCAFIHPGDSGRNSVSAVDAFVTSRGKLGSRGPHPGRSEQGTTDNNGWDLSSPAFNAASAGPSSSWSGNNSGWMNENSNASVSDDWKTQTETNDLPTNTSGWGSTDNSSGRTTAHTASGWGTGDLGSGWGSTNIASVEPAASTWGADTSSGWASKDSSASAKSKVTSSKIPPPRLNTLDLSDGWGSSAITSSDLHASPTGWNRRSSECNEHVVPPHLPNLGRANHASALDDDKVPASPASPTARKRSMTPRSVIGDSTRHGSLNSSFPRSEAGEEKSQGRLRKILFESILRGIAVQLQILDLQHQDSQVREVQKSTFYTRIHADSVTAGYLKDLREQLAISIIERKRTLDKIVGNVVNTEIQLQHCPVYLQHEVEAYTIALSAYMKAIGDEFTRITVLEASKAPIGADESAATDNRPHGDNKPLIKSMDDLLARADSLETDIYQLKEDTEEERAAIDDLQEQIHAMYASWDIERKRNGAGATELLQAQVDDLSDHLSKETQSVIDLIENSPEVMTTFSALKANVLGLKELENELLLDLEAERSMISEMHRQKDLLFNRIQDVVTRTIEPEPALEPAYDDFSLISEDVIQSLVVDVHQLLDGIKGSAEREADRTRKFAYSEAWNQLRPALAATEGARRWMRSVAGSR